MSAATIEDYKKYVRELKTRIKLLTEGNTQLKIDLERAKLNPKAPGKSSDPLTWLVRANKAILMIQRRVRGFLVRSRMAKTGRASVMVAKARQIDLKATSENELLMHDLQRNCKKIGLTLEMVFRAADTHREEVLTQETLKNVLGTLKLGLTKRKIDQIVAVFDEDNNGSIPWDEFCAALFSYNVASEPEVTQAGRQYLAEVLNSLREAVDALDENPFQAFKAERLERADFDSILRRIEVKTRIKFSEKDYDLLFSHFDRKKSGTIDKKVITLTPTFTNTPEGKGNQLKIVHGKSALARVVHTPVKKTISKVKKQEVGGAKTSQTLTSILAKLEKKGPNLGRFFDKLGDFLVQHRLKVFGKCLSVSDWESFLNISFASTMGEESIQSWVQETPTVRVQDTVAREPAGKMGPQIIECVDLIELKNSMLGASGKKIDTSRLLKGVLAMHLETAGLPTTDFLAKNGLRQSRKIEFPEFYLAAQKIFGSNYPESLALFESLDPQKQRCISVTPLVEELDRIRSGQNPPSVSATRPGDLEAAKKKMHLSSLEGIERILTQMQHQTGQLLQKLSKDQTNDLFKSLSQNKLSEGELRLLLGNIAFDESHQIDVYTLLDAMMESKASKKELVGMFEQVMVGYLDRNHPQQSTADFFKAKKLHPAGFYDKKTFEGKIREIFGFTQAHSQLFSEEFWDPETETVNAGRFISAIDAKRASPAKKPETAPAKKPKEEVVPEPPKSGKKESKENKEPEAQPKAPTKDSSAQNDGSKKPVTKTEIAPVTPKKEPAPSESKATANPTNVPAPTPAKKDPEPPKPVAKTSAPVSHDVAQIIEDKKPDLILSEADEAELLKKIESLKETQLHELISLHHYIDRIPDKSVPILQLRNYCSDLFDKSATRVLLQAFWKCDPHRNGSLDISEWRKLNKKMKLEVPKPQPKPPVVIPEFKSVDDVIPTLTQNLDSRFVLPLEYLSEFGGYQGRPVPIIELVKHAIHFYGKGTEGVEFYRRLLTVLDDDKNGFFSFSTVKMVVMLMNLKEIRATQAIRPLDFQFLMSHGLTLDVLRVLGNESADNFIRSSFMDFGKVEDQPTINLFALLKNLANCLHHFQDLEVAASFVETSSKNRKSMTIGVDDFVESIGAAAQVKKGWQKMSTSSLPESVAGDMRKLKSRLVRSMDGKYKLVVLKGADISKGVADAFQLDRSKSQDVAEFAVFLAYCQLPKPQQASPAAPQSTQALKFIGATSELVADFAYDNVTKKLAQVNLTTDDLEHLIDSILSDREAILNLLTFCNLVERLPLNLERHESVSLFDSLASSDTSTIQIEAFIELFRTIKRKNPSKKRESLRSVAATPTERKWMDSLKDKQLTPADYFLGRQTILNGALAALKKAADLVSGLKPLEKFKDPDFGPCRDDPYGKKALYLEETPAGYIEAEEVVWARIDQIAPDKKPLFVDKQAYANDVNQGAIGDCWMIAAISQLAMNDDLLFRKVPPTSVKEGRLNDPQTKAVLDGVYPSIFHFLAKYGLYVFRFFKDFDYRFVIIDDQLPCYNNGTDDLHLVFAHCTNRSVFWVPLIEKAYAKLHGCYEALIGGQMEEGVVDMTGFVADKSILKTAQNAFNAAELKSPEIAWKKWDAQLLDGSLLGCSVAGVKNQREADHVMNGERTGLFCGHAYSMMDFLEVAGKRLVRIRNPHGGENKVTWNGKFSNNTKELLAVTPQLNEVMQQKWRDEAELLVPGEDNGSFFMDFQDFVAVWQKVCLAVKFPAKFSGVRIAGEWNANNAGGTPLNSTPEQISGYGRNPQIIVNIKCDKEVSLFVSLSQEDGRLKAGGRERAPFPSYQTQICLVVMKLKDGESRVSRWGANETLNKLEIGNARATQSSLVLRRGKYVVVPSTGQMGYLAKFFLSIYFDCAAHEIEVTDSQGHWTPKPIREEDEGSLRFDDNLKRILTAIVLENAKN